MTVLVELVRDAGGAPTRTVLRRVYEDAIPAARRGGAEFINDVPWAVEGEDLDASQVVWEAAQVISAVEAARLSALDVAIRGDTTLAQLKAMTTDELDAWFNANISDLASARAMLGRVFKIIVRRLL